MSCPGSRAGTAGTRPRAAGCATTYRSGRCAATRNGSAGWPTTLAHLFASLLPYVADVDPRLDAHPHAPVAHLLDLLLRETPDRELYSTALRTAPSPAYEDQVLRRLAEDARVLPGSEVLDLLRTAQWRWAEPDRLRRVLDVLMERPGVDEGVKREAASIARKAEDQTGLRPFDGEVPTVLPGDVPGDRQP